MDGLDCNQICCRVYIVFMHMERLSQVDLCMYVGLNMGAGRKRRLCIPIDKLTQWDVSLKQPRQNVHDRWVFPTRFCSSLAKTYGMQGVLTRCVNWLCVENYHLFGWCQSISIVADASGDGMAKHNIGGIKWHQLLLLHETQFKPKLL